MVWIVKPKPKGAQIEPDYDGMMYDAAGMATRKNLYEWPRHECRPTSDEVLTNLWRTETNPIFKPREKYQNCPVGRSRRTSHHIAVIWSYYNAQA
jgi:hypothetical protein